MLQLEDGNLVVTDAGARYKGGQLSAELSADSRTPMPRLKVALHTEGIDLARLMSQCQKQTEYSGLVDADIDLAASGGTLDALRQSLAGSVAVSVRDGNVASRIGQQFVFTLIKVALPALRTKKVPSIGCTVADFAIEDGIATIGTLRLKDKEVSVTASGEIDLVHGLYDLRVAPTTTNPGIFGFVPEVLVTGNLDDPRFHAVKRTLATSFGNGLFKNALKAGGAILRPFRSKANAEVPGHDECRVQTRAPR